MKYHIRLIFTLEELIFVVDILCLRSRGWPPVHSVAKDGLKLPLFLPLPPESRDYGAVSPWWDITSPSPVVLSLITDVR